MSTPITIVMIVICLILLTLAGMIVGKSMKKIQNEPKESTPVVPLEEFVE